MIIIIHYESIIDFYTNRYACRYVQSSIAFLIAVEVTVVDKVV